MPTPESPDRFGARSAGNAKANGTNGHGRKYGAEPVFAAISPKPSLFKSSAYQGDMTMSEVVVRLRIWFAIVRSRWVVGLLAALVVGGLLSYILLVNEEPEHTAVTTMIAQSTLDELLRPSLAPRDAKKDGQENFLQNHLSVMRSRRFSVALAREFSEEERAAIMAPYLDPGSAATEAGFEQMLAGRMGSDRQRDREFFTLSFRHRDPDLAVLVADRMAATYLKLVQYEAKEANLAAAEMLRAQAEELQAEIKRLEGDQRNYRKEHNIVSLQENQGLLAERLRRIDQNRADARIARVRLEAQLKEAEDDLGSGTLPFDNPLLAGFANNQELRQELDRLNAQREVFALRYGANHPKMRDLDGQIAGVRDNLGRNFNLAFRDLQSQYDSASAIEKQLEHEFKVEFEEGIEIGRLANNFLLLGSEVDAKREALDDLLRRVASAAVVSKLPADVMRVVDPAYIAEPRLARSKIVAALIVLMATGTFLAAPLTTHLFDQRIKSATDVEKELDKDLLGGVPRLSRMRSADRPHVVRDGTDPSKVESFMTIVAQLELTSGQEGPKSFVVTSTVPGEGKSTIASNLLAGFTQLGRRALLVDGDLRRPCQHQLHRLECEGGLMSWAGAGCPMDDLFGEYSPLGIQRLANGSYLLPSGGVCPQPGQLLVSRKIESLFELLKERYDVIIVDTPPAGLFPDALVLAQSVGETLLIAREAKAPVSQIRRVIADIDKTAAPILGVILNDYSTNSLNPRLAYSGTYESYSYLMKRRDKEKVRSPAKTLVGKVMPND